MLTASALVAASLLWLPYPGPDSERVASEWLGRELLAAAIVQVTSDDTERALLMVTGIEESQLDPRVFDCRRKGDHGRSLGPWQAYAISPKQRRAICTDILTAAKVALKRIHQSQDACRHQPERWRLSAYASGSCFSKAGRAISERRFNRAAEAVRAAKEDS